MIVCAFYVFSIIAYFFFLFFYLLYAPRVIREVEPESHALLSVNQQAKGLKKMFIFFGWLRVYNSLITNIKLILSL